MVSFYVILPAALGFKLPLRLIIVFDFVLRLFHLVIVVMLPSFRRYILPLSSGSKRVGWLAAVYT
jgi:hypothetical protein